MPLEPGLCAEARMTVTEQDTAIALHTGEVAVLASPMVVRLCEEASVNALAGHLGPRETTVGMKVQLDHLAPTAVGHPVRAEATVERVNGRRITFTVSVSDERGLVAVGRITRVVVDIERFLDKTRD